jgi:hydrogenase maturation protein HypF
VADSEKEMSFRRLRITVRGAVQGVGFRPFVFRLATELELTGWVNNSSRGVTIELEGPENRLDRFLLRIEPEKPPRSFIQSLEYSYLDPYHYKNFEIHESDRKGDKTALILPDIATCSDCLNDMRDSADRRYLYPFTNCTNCGPRYSIISALPYDRPNTTMSGFVMCEECRDEYEDPRDRRFHAQPNACPKCGPHIELWDAKGKVNKSNHEALLAAAEGIRDGLIVAVKGIGGFHLMVDARNEEAVLKLRQRKGREEKPFALMYPSLETAREDCHISDLETRLLLSPESPIVLLKRNAPVGSAVRNISSSVAPGNPHLGIMLPYSPLHHILMAELGFPIVATSGNISDEPICTDEKEALIRLGGIAELFLVHNRPIARPIDDSVVRIMMGREMVIRRARGYAPLPVPLKSEMPRIFAVGAHLKNTIAISIGKEAFVSQHIGDLETAQAYEAFENAGANFHKLYDFAPKKLASDLHPGYLSSQFAERQDLPVTHVQHHYAHILSCMAENEIAPPALGVSWDGTGLGSDGTIWGGEFLKISEDGFLRWGHFRTFPLPGGDKAIKEPRRIAMGLLFEMYGGKMPAQLDIPSIAAFTPQELVILIQMLEKSINSHYTSSAGRLFDAAASIIGIRQKTNYEGQAAMELEYALDGFDNEASYPFRIDDNSETKIIDWQPMIEEVIKDRRREAHAGLIAAKFHNTMVEIILEMAQNSGERRIVLSGGCFQNRYLTERAVTRLQTEGFLPCWHQRIPPNDGGIALGQIVAAAIEEAKEGKE